jgi:hypothetical protein
MIDILIMEGVRVALQRHHDWHLNQTDEIDIGDGIQIVPADEYSDSTMYDETVAALDLLNKEIQMRIAPASNLNTGGDNE